METLGYKASMDNLAKIITLCVVVIVFAIGQNSVRTLLKNSPHDTATILVHSGIILFIIVILLGSFLLSPRGYELRDKQLIIKKPLGSKSIPLAEITEVKRIKKGEMAGTIRTFGVGGLFGYFGKFYNATFGHMTYYVTQRKNMILLKKKNGKNIVISPDDPGLAEKLEEKTQNSTL